MNKIVLFTLIGLCLTGCSKKEKPYQPGVPYSHWFIDNGYGGCNLIADQGTYHINFYIASMDYFVIGGDFEIYGNVSDEIYAMYETTEKDYVGFNNGNKILKSFVKCPLLETYNYNTNESIELENGYNGPLAFKFQIVDELKTVFDNDGSSKDRFVYTDFGLGRTIFETGKAPNVFDYYLFEIKDYEFNQSVYDQEDYYNHYFQPIPSKPHFTQEDYRRNFGNSPYERL